MREILFRVWRYSNGGQKHEIMGIYNIPRLHFLDKESGTFYYDQWTGLRDIRDYMIFEGDIIRQPYNTGYEKGKVVFHNGAFLLGSNSGLSNTPISDNCEIVGNVHDEMNNGDVMAVFL